VVLQGVQALPLLLCASMVDMVGVTGAAMEFAQICSNEDGGCRGCRGRIGYYDGDETMVADTDLLWS